MMGERVLSASAMEVVMAVYGERAYELLVAVRERLNAFAAARREGATPKASIRTPVSFLGLDTISVSARVRPGHWRLNDGEMSVEIERSDEFVTAHASAKVTHEHQEAR
jgi:hypothetical protein